MKNLIFALSASFLLIFSSVDLMACGDTKAQAATEAAVAAAVSQNGGKVCPTTGKVCPSSCTSTKATVAAENASNDGMRIVLAGQSVEASGSTCSGKACNVGGVMASIAAGMLLIFGAVTLFGRMKI